MGQILVSDLPIKLSNYTTAQIGPTRNRNHRWSLITQTEPTHKEV